MDFIGVELCRTCCQKIRYEQRMMEHGQITYVVFCMPQALSDCLYFHLSVFLCVCSSEERELWFVMKKINSEPIQEASDTAAGGCCYCCCCCC